VSGDEGDLCGGELGFRLLRGASLMLNEVAIFHRKSSSLLLADGFYPGYEPLTPPNAFSRVWFKMTKPHWTSRDLPTYRTGRVDDPEALVATLEGLVADWAPKSIIAAHGSRVPYTVDPGEALVGGWKTTLIA